MGRVRTRCDCLVSHSHASANGSRALQCPPRFPSSTTIGTTKSPSVSLSELQCRQQSTSHRRLRHHIGSATHHLQAMPTHRSARRPLPVRIPHPPPTHMRVVALSIRPTRSALPSAGVPQTRMHSSGDAPTEASSRAALPRPPPLQPRSLRAKRSSGNVSRPAVSSGRRRSANARSRRGGGI